MNPAYETSLFEVKGELPQNFLIITAYNPKGLNAPMSRNLHQDATLKSVLVNRGLDPVRVIGQSPDQSHQEPSWAVDLDLEAGLELARLFKQLAIYQVEGKQLKLHDCNGEQIIDLGEWQARVI